MRLYKTSNNFMKHLLFTLLLTGLSQAHAANDTFAGDPEAKKFIAEMHSRHNFDTADLTALFDQTKRRQDILDAISRPAEGKPWHEYRPIFLTRSRINGGVKFWKKHAAILSKAEKEYGVDASVIVAIIGVETRYGGNTGSYRVVDALSTLAFAYPPRSRFFRKELEEFLILSREEQIELTKAEGSYAGAMGLGQFIPSSYRNYAVDMDKDGKRDLWGSMEDILGSVTNYFHRHGWQHEQAVTMPANVKQLPAQALLDEGLKPTRTAQDLSTLGITPTQQLAADTPVALLSLEQKKGPEYWLTMKNFYVITRYNRSPLYAMAVYQLSQEIRDEYLRSQDK
jgi:membrane-bound lytic murein transglycosylase B